MRARLLIAIAGLGACGFTAKSGEQPDAAPGVDAAKIDAPVVHDAALPDGDVPCTSFSTQFNTCALTPMSPLTITGSKLYNTTTHVLSDLTGANPTTPPHVLVTTPTGQVDMLVATDFTIGTTSVLVVVGNGPFGIAATNIARIQGTIDATSRIGLRGAGARSRAACGVAAGGDASNDSGGAPGGGGGALRGGGGDGGDGDANGGGTAGASGGTGSSAPPAGVVGGCPGGSGGNGAAGAGGGAGGEGGGAIFITAGVRIEILGALAAGGGPGGGGDYVDGGGGAGGSGGVILLESPIVTVSGVLAANGGSGGGGGDDTGTAGGFAGASGNASATAAVGGARGGSKATAGANGSAGATLTGASQTGIENGGGGGGGGGAGFIVVLSAQKQLGGVSSPAAQ